MTKTDGSTAKVLDLVDFVADVQFATSLQVAQEFGLTVHEATLLLDSMPFDAGDGYGVYSVSGTVEHFLTFLEDPDQLLRDRLAGLSDDPDGVFRSRVLDGIEDIQAQLQILQERIDSMPTERQKSKYRRRKRGELTQPRLEDPEDLRAMRREAEVEIAQAKATGNRDKYQTVYARWHQRITSMEKKLKIGVYAEEVHDSSPAKDEAAASPPP